MLTRKLWLWGLCFLGSPLGRGPMLRRPRWTPAKSWVLVSAALVMLMTPGLAFFYCGMVRRKHVLGTIMQSYALLAVMTLQWMLWGYSLAFGPDVGSFIGTLGWWGLKGVGAA